MNLAIRLKDYLTLQRGTEHEGVSLELLLKPFGLKYSSDESDSLLAGMVYEALADELSGDSLIDPIDVASVALGLGYDPAEGFLDHAPTLMLEAERCLAAFSA